MAKIGRPTDNPAVNQFRIRLTNEDLIKLNECSDRLKINKSDIVRKCINDLHESLSETK